MMKMILLGFIVFMLGRVEASDYVVDVGSGKVQELLSPLDTDQRLVKRGPGTLVLPSGNSIRGGVLVSEGVLRADYVASGLNATHVAIDGESYLSPAYLQVVGDSFTAPVSATGNGTVSLNRYAGIVPYDRPLILNFGGDGRKLIVGENGFTPTDLILNNSTSYSVELLNPVDQKGKGNLTLKSGMAPLYVNHYTNSVRQGELNFWGGSLTFGDRSFFRTYRASWRDGVVLFTNATIRMYNDFSVGGNDSNSGVAKVTLKDCDKSTSWGTDHVNGNAGTVLTLDGGTYKNVGGMRLGEVTGKTGRLILTNNVQYACTDGGESGFYLGNGSRVEQYGGKVSLDVDSAQITIADGTYEVFGGELRGTKSYMKDCQIGSVNDASKSGAMVVRDGLVYLGTSSSVQIGSYGAGTFLQTGGETSFGGSFAVGRYATGFGSLRVHGGHFVHRSSVSIIVGELGRGTASVANGGVMEILDANGIMLGNAWGADAKKSSGTLVLSPDGLLKARRIAGAEGEATLVFNGGAFEVNGDNQTNSIINATYVNRAAVTALGGVIDSGANPVVRLARPLVAATADEASEALSHRWKFDAGSLADCIGGSTATIGGIVDWTPTAVRLKGGARGTSCIRLGTGLLPTDGRGATIQTTLTINKHTNWARVFDFGNEKAPLTWTFNRGGASSTFIAINGISVESWTGAYRLVAGNRYHFALVFDHEQDGTWRIVGYIHDPATGELLDMARLSAPKTFSLAQFASVDGRLGCSSAETDDDPSADYEDVRIYNRAMTADQVRASAMEGPDKIYYLSKKGNGRLLMSGANAYTVGTHVAEGSLRLADGATLPKTELRVDAGAVLQLNAVTQEVSRFEGAGTVMGGTLVVNGPILPGGDGKTGVLTFDGTTLSGGNAGKLVIDIFGGTSDRLQATGTLDLSTLDVEILVDALSPMESYEIVRASTVVGMFRQVKVPRGWTLSYGKSSVKLCRRGLSVVFR